MFGKGRVKYQKRRLPCSHGQAPFLIFDERSELRMLCILSLPVGGASSVAARVAAESARTWAVAARAACHNSKDVQVWKLLPNNEFMSAEADKGGIHEKTN